MSEDLSEYLEGKKLYGDDFTLGEIKAWYEDEEEAYASLAKGRHDYVYEYHGMNSEFGFRFLPDAVRFHDVLGFGSAYGCELIPIIDRIDRITIVEPSSSFACKDIEDVPVMYVKPAITGDLPFQRDFFDLITCLGVLHHIPNVSKVVDELYRCLKPGGCALIREPISSMGDWTKAVCVTNQFTILR